MDGILCIDKPGDHTSFDVVARVRGILKQRKAGHGGTLDPMATGVLPIFLGTATKCCDILPNDRKCYLAEAQLGAATDTQDCTGTITERLETRLTEKALREALGAFEGGYRQQPPMYSAIQVGGQRLYDLARQGVEVKREKRAVLLHRLELRAFDEEKQTFTLEVECGKGTYVRTLCDDIARRAGSAAYLTALRRTMSAGFTLADCLTLEELTERAAAGKIEDKLLPTGRAFGGLPRVYLSPKQAVMLRNGVKLSAEKLKCQTDAGKVAVYGWQEGFLAVAELNPSSGLLEGVKLFCAR
jgi:tRNA pseudouridine55 synthase